ncbi:MAG: gephyrin-like molybdotransferase Glp [Candidatus Dormibacteria bacterium]
MDRNPGTGYNPEGPISVEEARERLLALLPTLTPQGVPLADAGGLVLARDVVATRELPGFDNAAMDGFAVRAVDTRGASAAAPARLRLRGEVAAGAAQAPAVEPSTAVRIMTGAMVPAGADAVIEVERTTVEDATVLLTAEVPRGKHIRPAGGDTRVGDVALRAGDVLRASQLGLLAALGEVEPLCLPRPRVAVIPTGDELVDPGQAPAEGQVTDIVSTALPAAVREAGGEPLLVPRAGDTEADVRRAFAAAPGADLVVSVGGVSMGEYDHVRRVIEGDGRLEFWRVAMRPGKPLAVGVVGGVTVVGLPGNPVSALVGFEVYVLPALLAMSGRPAWGRPRRRARLTAPVTKPAGLRSFVRARLDGRAGSLEVAPLGGQESHQLRSLAAANALIDIPEAVHSLAAGDEVDVLVLDQPPSPPWLA